MIRKLIGTANVINGRAENVWEIDENTKPGKRKIYLAYVESDGYIMAETWENAYIKIPTTIVLDDESIIANSNDPSQSSYISLKAKVFNSHTAGRVTRGKVQFQHRLENGEHFTNIGKPVELESNLAEYCYRVPENTEGMTILIRAKYLSNKKYGSSESQTLKTIYVRDKVMLECDEILTTKGHTETITVNVVDSKGRNLNVGELNITLDNEPIGNVQTIIDGTAHYDYTFAEDISGGNHTLCIEYVENNNYQGTTITVPVYVRSEIVIDNSPVYAPQTLRFDDEHIMEGLATIPINITDLHGNKITFGTVTYSISGTAGTIELDEEPAEITYRIPFGLHGGDVIPCTISYLQNDEYQGKSIEIPIILKHQTTMSFDTFKGNIGDTVTLSATVTDETGNGVEGGTVEFEMETNEIEGNGENEGD